MDVLLSMVVTAAVPHFEMSALNAEASRNTEGIYVIAHLTLATQDKTKAKNCQGRNKQVNKNTKRWKVNVLLSKLVT